MSPSPMARSSASQPSIVQGPLSLKVQEPNARARAFYAREGFVCTEHGRDQDSDVAWLRLVRET